MKDKFQGNGKGLSGIWFEGVGLKDYKATGFKDSTLGVNGVGAFGVVAWL